MNTLDMTTKDIGQRGENAAVRFLRRRFYRIVARNYVAGKYEIDIIAETFRHIVFVEVKTRTQDPKNIGMYGSPSVAVTHKKRAFVVAAARRYLAWHKCDKEPRFDVIEVYLSPDKTSKILKLQHMKDAYRAY